MVPPLLPHLDHIYLGQSQRALGVLGRDREIRQKKAASDEKWMTDEVWFHSSFSFPLISPFTIQSRGSRAAMFPSSRNPSALFFVGRPYYCATSTLSVSCDKITGEEGDEQEEEEEEEATAWVLQFSERCFQVLLIHVWNEESTHVASSHHGEQCTNYWISVG